MTAFTPLARLIAALDDVRSALLDLRGSTTTTARHAIMDARDLRRAERRLDGAAARISQAIADLYGASPAWIDAAGEALDREQLAVLDATLELRAP